MSMTGNLTVDDLIRSLRAHLFLVVLDQAVGVHCVCNRAAKFEIDPDRNAIG